MFADFIKLEYVKISEGIEYIGKSAFEGCININRIELPNSLKRIGKDAFKRCCVNDFDPVFYIKSDMGFRMYAMRELEKIYYSFDDKVKAIFSPTDIDDSIYTSYNIKDKSVSKFLDFKPLTSITIPNNVEIINDYAFCLCKNLYEVHLPENIKAIGDEAFCNCANLEEIHLPKSLKIIGEFVFDEDIIFYIYKDTQAHQYVLANDCEYLVIDD